MADSENKLALPLARVKKIIKSDGAISNLSHNGAIMIAKATELFIGYLAVQAYENTKGANRKVLQEEDVIASIHESDKFEFLTEHFPQKEAPAAKKGTKKKQTKLVQKEDEEEEDSE